MSRALILFAHGARDPKWAMPFERLKALVQARSPEVAVGLGFLELMTPDLPTLVAELAGQGCTDVTVVPVFLGQGGHVQRDLPLIIERLRAQYPGLQIKAAPAVGEDALVLEAMAGYCVNTLGDKA
jgi:sirohydrochlorin cobaltochelatase